MNAHIEAMVQDYEADIGFIEQELNEVQEMDEYYDSLAAMERERHGIPEEKPERLPKPSLHGMLDALKPKEAAFQREIRERNPHRRMANRVLAAPVSPYGQLPRELEMSCTWPEHGPASSDEDFTPESL